MDDLNPATQSIADWGRKLIEDLEKTKNVLQGIVEKGEELDYFTEAMRKQIQIQTITLW